MTLIRELSLVEYDVGEFSAFLDEDEAFRERNPQVVGGPLRNMLGQMVPVPAFMRLDYRTDRDGPIGEHRPDLGPCWVWTGGLVKGYGYVRIGKRKVQAYRVNYERWVGPIPDGMLLDHLCRVRRCVHPLHVEPATWSENVTRSPVHLATIKARRTHCNEGHEYSPQNTRVRTDGARVCRKCNAAAARRYKATAC